MEKGQQRMPTDPTSFLLKDLEHFGESFLRNEELGEKRLEFFITLVTAVAGGLVVLYTAKDSLVQHDQLPVVTSGALATLLLLGFITYARILHRNRVTDQYQDTLRYVRRKVLTLHPELESYIVPSRIRGGRWERFRGGLAETVGALNAILLFALLEFNNVGHSGALAAGFVALVAGWALAARRKKDQTFPAQYFRAGVGAVIMNPSGCVFAAERMSAPGSWQFPQGGLNEAETSRTALYREVFEETGIREGDLELIATAPEPLVYELPIEAQSHKTGRGQVQRWYLLRFKGSDETIRIDKKEFSAWEWRVFAEVVEQSVDFRKPVYRQLLNLFQEHVKVRSQ